MSSLTITFLFIFKIKHHNTKKQKNQKEILNNFQDIIFIKEILINIIILRFRINICAKYLRIFIDLKHKIKRDRQNMENYHQAGQTALAQLEEKYPSLRIERLIYQERNSLEAKLNELKGQPNIYSVQTQIAQYQKLLDTINYFHSKGGFIEANERHKQEVHQIQLQIQQSKQEEDQLKAALLNPDMQYFKLKKAKQEQKEANYEIQQLKLQKKLFQIESFKEIQQYSQQIQKYQKQNSSTEVSLSQGLENDELSIQSNDISSRYAALQRQSEQINEEINQLYNEIRENSINHEQQIKQIQRNLSEKKNNSVSELENRKISEFNCFMSNRQQEWDLERQSLESVIFYLRQKIQYNQQALN